MRVLILCACFAVACRHESPRPQPIPREVKPLGPRPEITQPGTTMKHSMIDEWPSEQPAAARVPAPTTTPPQDASIDTQVDLPPVPDAAVVHDAGTPMR